MKTSNTAIKLIILIFVNSMFFDSAFSMVTDEVAYIRLNIIPQKDKIYKNILIGLLILHNDELSYFAGPLTLKKVSKEHFQALLPYEIKNKPGNIVSLAIYFEGNQIIYSDLLKDANIKNLKMINIDMSEYQKSPELLSPNEHFNLINKTATSINSDDTLNLYYKKAQNFMFNITYEKTKELIRDAFISIIRSNKCDF
jgi:hypothetical protein